MMRETRDRKEKTDLVALAPGPEVDQTHLLFVGRHSTRTHLSTSTRKTNNEKCFEEWKAKEWKDKKRGKQKSLVGFLDPLQSPTRAAAQRRIV